jgi:hypothetical protein
MRLRAYLVLNEVRLQLVSDECLIEIDTGLLIIGVSFVKKFIERHLRKTFELYIDIKMIKFKKS